jgi:NAD(P)H-dependent FMN reductase
MLKVGIITGSTRPNRESLEVAKWVLETAKKRNDADYVLVDIKDLDVPLLDEPMPPTGLKGNASQGMMLRCDLARCFAASISP